MSDVRLPDSDGYRDARPGVEAKRDQMLRRNRDALAELPLELRRVYVRRIARGWAGLVVLAGSLAAAMAAASPAVRLFLERLIPGRMPAVAADLMFVTPIAGLLAYFVARALAEERFTRAMIATVRAGGSAFNDVDRLAATPDYEARRLARGARARSIAAVIGAAAIAAPMLALVGAAVVKLDAWRRLSEIELLSWRAGGTLVQVAIASAVLAGAWLAIARDTFGERLRARARRSAGVLGISALGVIGLGGIGAGETRIFMWLWGAWGLGATGGLLWACARTIREDAIAS